MKLGELIPLIVVLIARSCPSYSKNILFYWGVSGYSHRISVWPIIDKLVEKGHKITFLSPFPPKTPSTHPNITDIVPKGLAQQIGLINLDFISLRLEKGVQGIDQLWYEYYRSGIRGCEFMMQNAEVLQWINESTFDLVILDALFNDCGYALVHKFQCPHIMYSPTSHFAWFKDAYGLPDENHPGMEFHYQKNMTFVQSVYNLLSPLYWQWKRHYELFPKLEKMLKSALNLPNLPPLAEIEKNTSLVLTNTHPSEEFSRSLPPNFVEVGGTHCTHERKSLSQEVEDFIGSGGDEGFILISFGTYAAISSLPLRLQDAFFEAMRALPQFQFLVKFDADPPLGISKNVKTLKWVQQQDVIAHPKIRAFIGHGGLLGTQEAVFHAVPMIVVPLFAEQDYQAVRAHQRESAIALELAELTEEKLIEAILEVTTNPKYKANTVKLSKLFRDRQNPPLDTAVWYIEYAMRHKDTTHLRPIGIDTTWYGRRNLHIWTFITFCILGVFIGAGVVIFILFSTIVQAMLSKIKSKQE